MKCVVLYHSADDVASKAPAHFADHVAHYEPYAKSGRLLMIGTFADPQSQGAMAIFTSREVAEEFVQHDPFVLHGVVREVELRDWNEVLVRSDDVPD